MPAGGICPNCETAGEVGEPCSERVCLRRSYHFVPQEYVNDGTAPDPMVGQLMGDYLPVSVIGAGGFGRVYLALQVPILMKSALKVMRAETLEGSLADALLRKFRGEAQALASLSHPHIVRLLKYGMHRESPYLVMEYVEHAKTLKDELADRALAGRPLERSVAKQILVQICDGLEAAHRLNIVHRDIKPENIMLQSVAGYEHFVRILDFGLAKFVSESSQTSMAMGTPTYMAPEQLTRRNIGPWTDLYATGVISFELLTGQRAFVGRTHQEILSQKLDPDFDPTMALEGKGLPETMLGFLRKSIANDPESRFRSASEFRDELSRAIASQPSDQGAPELTVDISALVSDTQRDLIKREKEAVEAAKRELKARSDEIASKRQALEGELDAISDAAAAKAHATDTERASAPEKMGRHHFTAPVDALASAPIRRPGKDTLIQPRKRSLKWLWIAVIPFIAAGTVLAIVYLPDDRPRPKLPATEEVKLNKLSWVSGADGQRFSRTEITVAQYMKCVKRGKCTSPHWVDKSCFVRFKESTDTWAKGALPSRFRFENLPVTCVTYDQARRYCRSLGGDLPTAATWKILYSQNGKSAYPWGDEAPSCQNAIMRDSASGNAACGKKARPQVPCSAPGAADQRICDLAGNVFEFLKNTGGNEATAQIVGGAFDSAGQHMVLPAADDPTKEFRVPLEESAYYNVGFRCVRRRGSAPRTASRAAPSKPPPPASNSRHRPAHDPSIAPKLGPAKAPHNVTVYSDFQCPYCRKLAPNLIELVRIARGKVSVTFKHFPLDFHRKAKPAAIASYCAHTQEKFWRFHDLAFEKDDALSTSQLEANAVSIGLDLPQYWSCLRSDAARQAVEDDIAEGHRKGVKGTPTIFINEVQYMGPRAPESLLMAAVPDEKEENLDYLLEELQKVHDYDQYDGKKLLEALEKKGGGGDSDMEDLMGEDDLDQYLEEIPDEGSRNK